MPIKVSINGFGRIGRAALKRIFASHPDLDLVAINDLTSPEALAHLLAHDSVYGDYNETSGWVKGFLVVGDKKIKVFSEPDPEKLPWKKLKIDVVLECTGRFSDLAGAQKHIKAGAKKVVISANAKDDNVPHFIIGVNEQDYDFREHDIIANCSCTTNCAAPIMKIIHENFGILKAQMMTIHAVTSTQNLVDGPHKDLRRARSAMVNTVPTTTGAAKAVVRVLPELKGKISGSAFRVPVICGSVLEIIAQIEKETNAEVINKIFIKQAKTKFKGIIDTSTGYLVSSDIIGTDSSAIVDLPLTEVLDLPGIKDENLIKVLAWYDNEWAYACRLAELAQYIGRSA